LRWSAIIVVFALGWLTLGDPKNDLANMLWPRGPAPWEQVDAYYYPSKSNLRVDERRYDVGGLDGCRSWVQRAANAKDDPRLARGDYECGVGFIRNVGGLKMYRLTTR
jgi:hypothetical protein